MVRSNPRLTCASGVLKMHSGHLTQSVTRARRGGAIARSSGALPVHRLACLLLVSVLGACAARAPYTSVMAPAHELPEPTVERLVGVWQQQLQRYIAQAGAGDPGVLLQARALQSRAALRPAQVTFDAVDVEATVPDRDGWDVQGVLIGRYADDYRTWSVFLVGIVERERYRPVAIRDIRLVRTSLAGGKHDWSLGLADSQTVQRYRQRQSASAAVRFPGPWDQFDLSASAAEVRVRERRSGADWVLAPAETLDTQAVTDRAGRSGRS